jgi:hypothetical protein
MPSSIRLRAEILHCVAKPDCVSLRSAFRHPRSSRSHPAARRCRGSAYRARPGGQDRIRAPLERRDDTGVVAFRRCPGELADGEKLETVFPDLKRNGRPLGKRIAPVNDTSPLTPASGRYDTKRRMSPRRTETVRPSRVFTVSFGAVTAQHSLGESPVKTDQSVCAATWLVDSCAQAPVARTSAAASPMPRSLKDVMSRCAFASGPSPEIPCSPGCMRGRGHVSTLSAQ